MSLKFRSKYISLIEMYEHSVRADEISSEVCATFSELKILRECSERKEERQKERL